MGIIATELAEALRRRQLHGVLGGTSSRLLARGNGWTAHDVMCTSGPSDRRFEERHSGVSVAIVAAGSFGYRSTAGSLLLTPGSILLGRAGHCFECEHEHAAGDRCVAFNFAPEYFERVTADAGATLSADGFARPGLPPLRELANLVARALGGVIGGASASWEEIGLRLAAAVARLGGASARALKDPTTRAVASVTHVVREVERALASPHSLRELADVAGMSPFHFLRTFVRVTGLTPHQYVRRARLRDAATRLATVEDKVIDVAFGSGFGDLSNFNHAFRAEFGQSPRAFRSRATP